MKIERFAAQLSKKCALNYYKRKIATYATRTAYVLRWHTPIAVIGFNQDHIT